MNKIIFPLVLFILSLIPVKAKAQFSVYTPLETPEEISNAQIIQTYGYVPTSSGWVRVNIKVRTGRYSVTIVGYNEKNNTGYSQYFSTYGGNSWHSCNTRAEDVTEFSDGTVAANNFDYKAYVSGLGYVYF